MSYWNVNFELFFSMVYIYVCVHVGACVQRSEVNTGFLPQLLSTLSFESGSHWTWMELTELSRLAWVAGPQEPYLHLPEIGLQILSCYTCLFTWILRIKPHILMFVCKHLTDWALSPTQFFIHSFGIKSATSFVLIWVFCVYVHTTLCTTG